ncbi:hypothetical protein ACFL1H_04030, partial [Nanoarchaeota archaeon]
LPNIAGIPITINVLKIKYDIKTGGRLILRDDIGRTVVLHDAYWDTKEVEKEEISGIFGIGSSPLETDINKSLFEGLYFGIWGYHHIGELKGYEDKLIVKLKEMVEDHEIKLIDILRKDNQIDVDKYLWHKKLVS